MTRKLIIKFREDPKLRLIPACYRIHMQQMYLDEGMRRELEHRGARPWTIRQKAGEVRLHNMRQWIDLLHWRLPELYI